MMDVVIGLEVHVQLKTKSKIFCSCSAEYTKDIPPNTHICEVCTGQPGALPVFNKKVLEYGILLALATKGEISPVIRFERKNYFYPDLPKSYQISQYRAPLSLGGFIELKSGKKIRLERIHMEEDAGKLVHVAGETFVDFNRAGVPLLEIVTRPDISSPDELVEFLMLLRETVRYLGISDGDMEEGSLRCDANISLKPEGASELGTKVEIKNINSFKFVKRALEYEIERQSEILKSGGTIVQETRLFNEAKAITESMRTKEEAHDYRYFPDPDLVPIEITEELVNRVKENLVELPIEKYRRFMEEYGLNEERASILKSDLYLADFFEKTVKLAGNPEKVANWLTVEITGISRDLGIELRDSGLTPEKFSSLLKLLFDGKISRTVAKSVLKKTFETDEDPIQIVEREGLMQSEEDLGPLIEEILKTHGEQVREYCRGKEKLIPFFIGQAMKKTRGKANPVKLKKLFEERLEDACKSMD